MEQTYFELTEKLYHDVMSDSGIPSDEKTEILETIASLRDLLWVYSA